MACGVQVKGSQRLVSHACRSSIVVLGGQLSQIVRLLLIMAFLLSAVKDQSSKIMPTVLALKQSQVVEQVGEESISTRTTMTRDNKQNSSDSSFITSPIGQADVASNSMGKFH